MVNRRMTIVSAMASVITTIARVLAIATNTELRAAGSAAAMVRNMTTNTDRPVNRTSSAIEVTSTIVVATTIRTVALKRPGVGASSARRKSSHERVRSGASGASAATVMT